MPTMKNLISSGLVDPRQGRYSQLYGGRSGSSLDSPLWQQIPSSGAVVMSPPLQRLSETSRDLQDRAQSVSRLRTSTKALGGMESSTLTIVRGLLEAEIQHHVEEGRGIVERADLSGLMRSLHPEEVDRGQRLVAVVEALVESMVDPEAAERRARLRAEQEQSQNFQHISNVIRPIEAQYQNLSAGSPGYYATTSTSSSALNEPPADPPLANSWLSSALDALGRRR